MTTGISSLDKSVQKSVKWIVEIQDELGWEDREDVYIATKAVLQTVRDRLPFKEAVQFSAQLPMLMKGMFFEGYSPSKEPLDINQPDEFYQKVQERSINKPINAEQATKNVLAVIQRKISKGEIEDIVSNFPKTLRSIWIPPLK